MCSLWHVHSACQDHTLHSLYLDTPVCMQVNVGLLTRDDIISFAAKLQESAHKIRVLRLVCMPK